MEQLQQIKTWLLHHTKSSADKIVSQEKARGYLVLFEGTGTNKITTAETLGKEFNKEVHRVILSELVSKYIGETEKNLERVFIKAAKNNWVLFFDEADALFGKRTGIKDSHDRYANQEVSYLLQKIEDYPGLVIIATNGKKNFDKAFIRRFQVVVHF